MTDRKKCAPKAVKMLAVVNSVYKLMGTKGCLGGIAEGPKLYVCKYSLDNMAAGEFWKTVRDTDGILARIDNRALTIEIPKINQDIVNLKPLLSTKEFRITKNTLPIMLGVNPLGKPMIIDLARAPHILVAGASGTGKSTFLKSVYASLTKKMKPGALKFVIIDSKNTDFTQYKASKYLPWSIIDNADKGVQALQNLVNIMDERYRLLKSAKVKSVAEYQKTHKDMPYIIVLVDELSDLIAKDKRTTESCIQQITQKARAVGVHIIIATRDLSRGTLSNLVLANFPTFIAFKTRDKTASLRILGEAGAEQLLRFGDALLSDAGRPPVRLHPGYVS